MKKQEFIDLVTMALENIEQPYRIRFGLRPYERILCYEFYHQFRNLLARRSTSLVLHGELDKRYRDVRKIPDFVFHVPGTDERNLAVIEFKSTESGIRWIKYDLKKLEGFMRSPFFYEIGMMIVFGRKRQIFPMRKKLGEEIDGMGADLNILFYDLISGRIIVGQQWVEGI